MAELTRPLTEMNIEGFDSFTFEGAHTVVFDFTALGKPLKVKFSNLLFFAVSNNSTEPHCPKYFDIIETYSSHSIPTKNDIGNTGHWYNAKPDKPMHIIETYGDTIIQLICEKIELI